MRAAAHIYRRREPTKHALYRVLQQHLETFLARVEAHGGGLPSFVVRELRALLDCGLLCRGFARVHCSACGKDELVALPLPHRRACFASLNPRNRRPASGRFSCKRRGICPSCCARRSADLAAHLVDHVLPDVPIRQWVLGLPFDLRYLLGYDAEPCRAVRGTFIRTVLSWIERRARDAGAPGGRCGAVVAIQRFDSALRLNVHLHALVLDGVFVDFAIGEKPAFVPIDPPDREDLERLCRSLQGRITALLVRAGRHPAVHDPASDPFANDHPTLATCYAAAAQGRIAFGPHAGRPECRPGRGSMRRIDDRDPRPGAELDGYSLDPPPRSPRRPATHRARTGTARDGVVRDLICP